ncbi:rhomboid family intramembrane serine protease [Nonomuraea sp. NBC_01738]|uniref:rhomboid family intramembrane serine protease n=1 Tax=Nonomuraea sp. NBC_01738 TaxID=2976003 RepID=UPI002E0F835A|nr:rhomboid family intramembrane serine protease [Nonomuraea sp. NBC_01738]
MNDRPSARSRFGVMLADALGAVALMVVVLAVMWGIEVADYVLPADLDEFGIRGWDPAGLVGILFAPFLHVGFGHLMANSLPLLILGFLAAVRGMGRFLAATVFIILIGGLGTWLTSPGVIAVGASGLIFGYFGYVVARGVFDRSLLDIVIALGVAGVYYSMLAGVLPNQPGISWQGHLFGLIAGVLAAFLMRRRKRLPRSTTPDWTLPGA